MEINYRLTHSTSKPDRIFIADDFVYLRKNITNDIDESGQLAVTNYHYQEAVMTISEFNAYANKYLMSGQETNENNQLTLMEAFADLYEAQLKNNS